MYGVYHQEDGWHARFDRWAEAVFGDESKLVDDLASDVTRTSGTDLEGLVGQNVLEQEIIRRAALVALEKSRGRPRDVTWARTGEEIGRALTSSVVVVPAGGVYCSHVDDDGNAMPVELGASVLAGHLDAAMSDVIAGFARHHGHVGFRFTDESWWTEDLLGAREDPEIAGEILEGQIRGGSWPWMVFACRLPASGPVAELGAVAVTEAILGALVLLDHPPASYWHDTLPWIPGGLTLVEHPREPAAFATDNVLPIRPQIVDGRHRRLDNADSETSGRFPAEIDLGAHADGPASRFIAAVADGACGAPTCPKQPELLASACRLAWHAVASQSADVRIALVDAALLQLLSANAESPSSHATAYEALCEAGTRWRAEEAGRWPPSGSLPGDEPLDLSAWRARLSDESSRWRWGGGEILPAWSGRALEAGQRALHSLQACAMGVAAGL